ncbi:MAG TPA: SDR family oxidoreductase [Thermoleophilaceae bacterium]|nr:SDR family oxidoreductase [Thermoleophilaceae bacterium]
MAGSAIVTGSDSGIGRASAVRLARDGFDVGITWHSDRGGAEGAAREVNELGRRAAVTQLDVTSFADAGDTIAALADELGGLDVLVNNSGGGATHAFLDWPLEEWQQVLDVKLTGPFGCAQRASRLVIDAGTHWRIINITSVHEHVPLREAAAYCAAKGGLGLLTKVMALELGEHGITVNSIAPGEIATPMTGAHEEDPAQHERPALPAGRPGNAHEVAALVAFLASPDARYITGSSYPVDGGLLLTAGEFNRQAARS